MISRKECTWSNPNSCSDNQMYNLSCLFLYVVLKKRDKSLSRERICAQTIY